MKQFLVSILLLISSFCFSQNNVDTTLINYNDLDSLQKSNKEFICTDCGKNFSQAQFPGGDKALMKYLASKLELNDSIQLKCIEPFIVIQFEIDTLGKVQNPAVIKSNCMEINEICKQAMLSLPNFTPAKENNKAVRSFYKVPLRITHSLD